MIIDSHMHFGHSRSIFNISNDRIIEYMDKYSIGKGILSADRAEFGHQLKPIPIEHQADLFETNNKLKEFADRSNGRLKASIWCTPRDSANGNIDLIHSFLCQNKDTFVGLKFHPYHSKLAITDKLYEPFFELADALNMPVLIHCSPDEYGSPYQLASMAEKFPAVRFIMAHLCIATENDEAIDYIAKFDNLYGDTSWVKYFNIKKAISKCSSQKILFGTDAPIDGEKTYDFYKEILEDFRSLKTSELENVMCLNARALYHL